MATSHADIATDAGAKLVNRLCKHWAHKLEVEHEGGRGRVLFDQGVCLMEADDERLRVSLEAQDAAVLERLEDVVASHLERMAGGVDLGIAWER